MGEGYDPLQLCFARRSSRKRFLLDSSLDVGQIFLYYLRELFLMHRGTILGDKHELACQLVLFRGLVPEWESIVEPFGISIRSLLSYFRSVYTEAFNDAIGSIANDARHTWFTGLIHYVTDDLTVEETQKASKVFAFFGSDLSLCEWEAWGIKV